MRLFPADSNVLDIPAVPVEALHERLGFDSPVNYPDASRRKPLTDWRMEDDDSPILRHIYRHFRPRRHLEFGTWEGTGALYVLEECDATVWTINLPEGELREDGTWAYGTNYPGSRKFGRWVKRICTGEDQYGYQTDARGFIGRYYIERGLGHRVCQIYADSRDWDISNYPEGFFDTCLIDGGHQRAVVVNDTRKALRLVRPGGLILWHDFCPVSEVLRNSVVARGVVSAIRSSRETLARETQDLFWVDPSYILIGVR